MQLHSALGAQKVERGLSCSAKYAQWSYSVHRTLRMHFAHYAIYTYHYHYDSVRFPYFVFCMRKCCAHIRVQMRNGMHAQFVCATNQNVRRTNERRKSGESFRAETCVLVCADACALFATLLI